MSDNDREWGYERFTILDRVNEIEVALRREMYQSALALALTLPDICGKVETPNLRSEQRAKDWFNKHVAPRFMPKPFSENDPEKRIFSGEVYYKLRCAYLHAGNDDIKTSGNDTIVGQEDLGYDVGYQLILTTDISDIIECDSNDARKERKYIVRINVPDLCAKICDAVRAFTEGVGEISVFDQNTISLYSSKKWKQDRKAFFEMCGNAFPV